MVYNFHMKTRMFSKCSYFAGGILKEFNFSDSGSLVYVVHCWKGEYS